ncbi:CATRA conflict system CASPASE/TPR repeat-associated protein [Micromonospora sp. NBC_00860]|uniref:CATRA conflict system CASPASE/TPR repeat-associated protein n=1 Tax=Micromonospora sp. NBC_00860 TaxID=2975980 RepID=UPI003863D677|nr:BN6_48550 family protein [Micromonospora sp. NBC_00860]
MTMPASLTVTEPALLAHAFFAADGRGPEHGGETGLRALWDAMAKIGLVQEIAGIPEELRPVAVGGFTERLTVLGGLQTADGAGQFIVYQDHDVLGASLLLAPDTAGTSWIGLQREWEKVLGEELAVTGAFGSAVVYLAQVNGEIAAHTSIKPLLALLPAADRANPAKAMFDRGISLWELPPIGAGAVAQHRRFAAIAPPSEKDALDRWLWSDDRPGLVPFTRYLLHAAKLRYQQLVLVRDLPAVREAIADARKQCDALTAELQHPLPPVRLRATSGRLAGAQSRERGLVDSLSRIRAMAGTVHTAERNMTAALEKPAIDQPGSPLDNDRHIAAWLTDQLATEETYLQATNERVSQVTGIVATAVETTQRTRQESLTLLQTSLLGGLVTMLAAIQSLEYKLPIRPALNAPLIAALSAIAVWLPTAILHWPPGSRRGRWRLFDGLLYGFVGGTLAWLATGIVGVLTTGDTPHPHWTLPIAAIAGLCATAVPRLRRGA